MFETGCDKSKSEGQNVSVSEENESKVRKSTRRAPIGCSHYFVHKSIKIR